jgi:hypothetical protein
MRAITFVLLVLVANGAAPRLASAEQPNGCKQCSDQRRACTSSYSAKTCQTEYDRCMKDCRHK